MAKLIKVLSIDGGGIRGIIPAMLLTEIEKRTGQQIAELFHLIAGTSTGGIIALAITKPNAEQKPEYPAKSLIDIYEKEGRRIFPNSIFNQIRNYIDEKYPAEGLESVLKEYLGESWLSEALTEVLITSYEIEQRRPYFFKTRKAKLDRNRDFLMRQVARATSAAPTYFEPVQLKTYDGLNDLALIDGGVFANNPAMSAYVEAKILYPDAQDFLVVSLGTGQLTARLPYEKVKDWGLLEWSQPILNVAFDGVSDAVDYQLNELLASAENKPRRYYRFQVQLSNLGDSGDRMDDASPRHIQYLKDLAQKMIESHEADTYLNTLSQLLVTSR